MRRILLAIVAVLAMGALAACGAGEKNDYIEQVNSLQSTAQTEISTLMSSVNPGADPAAAGTAITALADRADKLATDIEALDAPEDFAEGDGELVKAWKDFAETCRTAATAITAGDLTGAMDSLGKLTEIQTRGAAAVDSINNAR